jgi:hypothetical protein
MVGFYIGALVAVMSGVFIVWVWKRRATIAENELSAIGSCGAYHAAQTMFCRNDWDALPNYGCQFAPGTSGVFEYASDFRDLNACLHVSGRINLIPAAMACAKRGQGKPYYGYYFEDLRSIGGRPIDWVSDHGLCATPARYGVTGWRTFIVMTPGIVWAKDLGGSEFVEDFPADPAAEGWEKVE